MSESVNTAMVMQNAQETAAEDIKPPDAHDLSAQVSTIKAEDYKVSQPPSPAPTTAAKKDRFFSKFFSSKKKAKAAPSDVSEHSKSQIVHKEESQGKQQDQSKKGDEQVSQVLPPTADADPEAVGDLRKSIQKTMKDLFHFGKVPSDTSLPRDHEVPTHDSLDRPALPKRSFVSAYHFCSSKVIGKGASSVVKLAEGNVDHTIYAVKEFRKRRKDEEVREYTKKLSAEFCISSMMDHPNVVHTYDILQEGSHWYEIMEYCPCGDLYNVIRLGFLDIDDIDICFKELLLGVQYIHSLGVAHRDLKPENLLIDAQGRLKITDFGVSDVFRVVWQKQAQKSTGICGSAPYISPEVLLGKEYDATKMDIWACAIIYYAMKFHGIPWGLASPKDPSYARYLKNRGTRLDPFDRFSQGPRNLLRKMLDPNPDTRLSINEVLADPWVQQINLNDRHHFQALLEAKNIRRSS